MSENNQSNLQNTHATTHNGDNFDNPDNPIEDSTTSTQASTSPASIEIGPIESGGEVAKEYDRIKRKYDRRMQPPAHRYWRRAFDRLVVIEITIPNEKGDLRTYSCLIGTGNPKIVMQDIRWEIYNKYGIEPKAKIRFNQFLEEHYIPPIVKFTHRVWDSRRVFKWQHGELSGLGGIKCPWFELNVKDLPWIKERWYQMVRLIRAGIMLTRWNVRNAGRFMDFDEWNKWEDEEREDEW